MHKDYTGIDGCRGGWFAVVLQVGDGYIGSETQLFKSGDHKALAELCNRSELVLIDIPLGLPDKGAIREPDLLVRRALGRRGGSIFPVPSREAVYAENYNSACTINLELQGKKISKQAWNLVPKIRDIDRFLQTRPLYREVLRESSPEFAFQILAGGPLAYKKTDPEGIEERLTICEKRLSSARGVLEQSMDKYSGKASAPHDILDALVLAVTAMKATRKGKLKMPDKLTRDRFGIPVQAVFSQ